MDLTAITLTELRYLVALADTGHFGKAAAQCFVTQPTLSTQLKKLENNLGVVLIERGSRRVQLTPVGQQVVALARNILREVRAIGDVVLGHSEPLTGDFRLGVIPTLAPYLLPKLLLRLERVYPRLRLAVTEQITAGLVDALLNHSLDAALLALPLNAEGIKTAPLFEEPFWVLLPRNHLLARKPRVQEGDLAEQTVLLLTEGHCLREQALSVCSQANARVTGDFRATSLETLRHLVGAGYGCTLIPELAVAALSDGRTRVRRLMGSRTSRLVGLAWRTSYPRPQAISALGNFIRSEVEHAGQGSIRVCPPLDAL